MIRGDPVERGDVRNESELVSAASRNFLGSFRKLVEHSAEGELREAGGVFAFVTGHPISLFNGCVVVEPTTPAQLEAALAWVRGRGVPHRAWIAQELVPKLGDVPQRVGLDGEPAPYPGMALHPVPESPRPPAGVTAVPVAESGLDDFLHVSVELGLPRELAERVFSPSFAFDPDVRLFSGWLEGRPVGTALAIRTGVVGGVYNVGTLAAARRRGVGTALTWATVAAGRDWGCDTIVLQSSAMALSMYRTMGFRTVAPYMMFGAPKPAEEGD